MHAGFVVVEFGFGFFALGLATVKSKKNTFRIQDCGSVRMCLETGYNSEEHTE